METELCPGCGGIFPKITGPRHPYMESSPGCWAAYGEILARQYTDPLFSSVLQLTVDAYAAQHPGRPSPQSIQSVNRHLISLCLTIEGRMPPDRADAVIQQTEKLKGRFIWLDPPWPRGEMTVANLGGIADPARHINLARAWAEQVWQAWSAHHTAVYGWISELRV